MASLLCHWMCLLNAVLTWQVIGAYRPVIIMHGIFDGPVQMGDMASLIQNAQPGTAVYTIDGYNDLDSMTQMWDQVNNIREKMQPIFDNSTDGVNLICYSQGGLLCRAILETTPKHNVKTFVSLSSPQGGQFGDTDYLKFLFPNYTKEHIYEFFYSGLGQDISIANYWKDPHHLDLYFKHNKFLPALNYPTDPSYKTNFLNVEKLVLIGGPDDGVITPWQSSHFAFYDENEKVVELVSQKYYLDDTFGLQTLNAKGNLYVYEIPGVEHTRWHGDKDVFNCCVAPHLW